MTIKAPAMQFYIDDWLSDEKLSACSMGAQGLWIKLICLMYKNDKKGYLQYNGKPPSIEQLARITGFSRGELRKNLKELIEMEVPSLDENGILFSRRIVRDERKRKLCIEAGKKGGNPLLLSEERSAAVKGKDNRFFKTNGKGGNKGHTNPKLTPSYSSPFSKTETKEKKDKAKASPSAADAASLPSQNEHVPYENILEFYNKICMPAGMPEAMLTEGRRKKLLTRWKEPVFRQRWQELFQKASQMPFLAGDNHRGWKADFGWLIENNENYIKVLEGKYLTKVETDEERERKKFNGWTRKEYIAMTLAVGREMRCESEPSDGEPSQSIARLPIQRMTSAPTYEYGESAERKRYGGLNKKEFLQGTDNNECDGSQNMFGNDGRNVAGLETNANGIASLGEILSPLSGIGGKFGD